MDYEILNEFIRRTEEEQSFYALRAQLGFSPDVNRKNAEYLGRMCAAAKESRDKQYPDRDHALKARVQACEQELDRLSRLITASACGLDTGDLFELKAAYRVAYLTYCELSGLEPPKRKQTII